MRFKIAARALRQLGAELITSNNIALNELIKNALDAKAKRVKIKVQNPFLANPNEIIKILLSKGKSDLDTAVRELVIPGNIDLLDDFESSVNKEKYLSVDNENWKSYLTETVKKLINTYCFMTIEDDGCGMSKKVLEDAFLVIGTPNKWLAKDSDENLLGEKGVGRLSMMRLGRYATVSSTVLGSSEYNSISFDWSDYDNPDLYLDDIQIASNSEVDDSIKNKSGTKITITNLYDFWDESKLNSFINEYIRRLQNPFNKDKRRFPIDIILNDKRLPVNKLYGWFEENANIYAEVDLQVENEIRLTRKLRWRGQKSFEIREWGQEDLLRIFDCDLDDFIALGSFKLNFLWFNRSDIKNDLLDRSISEVRHELNLWCGGYAIYRDNFRIGVTGSLEDDWLKADSGSLRSKGFSFNRYQTVGALDISHKNNPKLVDAANREKLVECQEFSLLKEVLTYINTKDIKSHIEFYKENERDKLATEITAETSLSDAKKRITSALKSANELSKSASSEDKKVINEIKSVLKTQQENIRKYERGLSLAEEQRMEVLELAGLGMVVDKIVHELARMTRTTVASLLIIEKNKSSEEVAIQVKTIKEQIKSIDKRIRTVDTLSPSGRHRKELFNVYEVIKSTLNGFSGRFKNHDVHYEITMDGEHNFSPYRITMVLGLLALLIENLVSNSIYWLTTVNPEKRLISIDIDTKTSCIYFTDNGPGIDEKYKEEIFRPYFTTSRNGKGLGLFISKEIADYHQVSIYLDPEKNEEGRLNTFVLELPKEK